MNNQFFIVGAQRSGTTYLYNILDEHPEICMAKPVKPEPKYFLQNKINIEKYYSKYYKNCTNVTKILGEKSTSYYENESVAQKISVTFPMAKIVFILANPVDRAISNYKFSYENGIETRTLEEVFIDEKKIDISKYTTSVNPLAYKERGLYYKYLEYYYKYFSKDQIKIIIREEFVNNLDSIQQLYSYLDVNNDYIPTIYNKIVNPSNIKIQIPSKVRMALSDYYKQANKKLENMLNREIKQWR